MSRPQPPDELFESYESIFKPAPELEAWARESIIESAGPIHNPDHQHLEWAHIGFLWTNVHNSRQMRDVAGMAELGTPPQGLGKWAKAKWEFQVRNWFGAVPDFIITIYAPCAAELDNDSFCALIEHELYHCGQRVDEFGAPKFRKDGRPVFGILGHDVEEFVGIVRRYGVGAAAGDTKAMVEAAKVVPQVGAARINAACGTCKLRLA